MEADLKERILQATIAVFNQKGLKFTMDDIAQHLSISKKTIYTVFTTKDDLLLQMVEYCFSGIREAKEQVLADTSLDTVSKIRKLLGVMPDGYQDINLRQLYALNSRYPEIYREVEKRLENGWEGTIALLEQGIREGCIRPIPISILKTMMEATLEHFFQRDVLIQSGISYTDALAEVVNILMDGITLHP